MERKTGEQRQNRLEVNLRARQDTSRIEYPKTPNKDEEEERCDDKRKERKRKGEQREHNKELEEIVEKLMQ